MKGNILRSEEEAINHITMFGNEAATLYESTFFQCHSPAWKVITRLLQKHISTPQRILSLFDGPGEPSLSMAKAFPDAQVISSDVEEAMVAKAKVYTFPMVTCCVADAEKMEFDESSFDVVVGCFGLMFVDRPKVLQGIKRILHPEDGLLVVSVWKSLPQLRIAEEFMDGIGSSGFRPDYDPLVLAQGFDRELEAAGFRVVATQDGTLDYDFSSESEALAAMSLMLNPHFSKQLGPRGLSSRKAQRAFSVAIAPFKEGERVIVGPNSFTVFLARPYNHQRVSSPSSASDSSRSAALVDSLSTKGAARTR